VLTLLQPWWTSAARTQARQMGLGGAQTPMMTLGGWRDAAAIGNAERRSQVHGTVELFLLRIRHGGKLCLASRSALLRRDHGRGGS
jgi:predicted acyl esterase